MKDDMYLFQHYSLTYFPIPTHAAFNFLSKHLSQQSIENVCGKISLSISFFSIFLSFTTTSAYVSQTSLGVSIALSTDITTHKSILYGIELRMEMMDEKDKVKDDVKADLLCWERKNDVREMEIEYRQKNWRKR